MPAEPAQSRRVPSTNDFRNEFPKAEKIQTEKYNQECVWSERDSWRRSKQKYASFQKFSASAIRVWKVASNELSTESDPCYYDVHWAHVINWKIGKSGFPRSRWISRELLKKNWTRKGRIAQVLSFFEIKNTLRLSRTDTSCPEFRLWHDVFGKKTFFSTLQS